MHKPRLRRLETLYTSSPVYFVTTCTHDRAAWLAGDRVHECFMKFCMLATNRGVFVGRYVLMPDHLHLFAGFASEALSLSVWMQALKKTLAAIRRADHCQPPYWQKRFFDHVLRSSESYAQKWLYVRENPVRAGLVKKWDDWPYQGEIFAL